VPQVLVASIQSAAAEPDAAPALASSVGDLMAFLKEKKMAADVPATADLIDLS
jgi:hypothetical protein